MSATTPIEYTFDSSGSLKSSKKLSNLKLTTTRPSFKPVFANTGQIIGRAYAGGGKGKGGSVGPLNPMPKYMASIEEPSATALPPPGIPGLERQGDDIGGGMVVPDAVAQDVQAGKAVPGGDRRGTKSLMGNKKLLIGGVISIAAVIVIYFVFFAKNKKGKRKKRKY